MTDYDPSLHAPARPKHMELPPLLKLVMERNRKQRLDKAGQTGQETDLLLPAYKVYDKDVRLTDTVEPNLSLADLIGIYIRLVSNLVVFHPKMLLFVADDEFATHKKYDIMSLIPEDGWRFERPTSITGKRTFPSYSEGN